MSEVDLDGVRKRHISCCDPLPPHPCDEHTCQECEQPWPCDAIRLVDEVEWLQKEFYREVETIAEVHDNNIKVFQTKIDRLTEEIERLRLVSDPLTPRQ